jgi:hypothetical protein
MCETLKNIMKTLDPPQKPLCRRLLLLLCRNLASSLDSLQQTLTVLVKLELGDDDVGRVDAKRDGLAVCLVTGDSLNVDNVCDETSANNHGKKCTEAYILICRR